MKDCTPARLSLDAPAKINLTLSIGGRRPDGFHDLESLFQAVDVCDRVVLEDVPDGPRLTVTTSDPALPCDERNTALRAARLLQERHAPARGARIFLEKRIPFEAGLGGGSSDAAAVLLGLNRLWRLGLAREDLLPLAAAVGSDVPFFLTGGCAVVRGRGERVQPFAPALSGWLVLVKPPFGVSTARAYADLAASRQVAPRQAPPLPQRGRGGRGVRAMCRALRVGDAGAVARALLNDLEAPVLAAHPEIGVLKEQLRAAGALGALLSGSGSTVFGVFASEDAARGAAERLAGHWPWVVAVPAREASGE